VGSAKHDIGQAPKPQETCIGAIGCGEKDIGVKKSRSMKADYFGGRCGTASGSRPSFFTSRRARR
jgi:hypothetical protein